MRWNVIYQQHECDTNIAANLVDFMTTVFLQTIGSVIISYHQTLPYLEIALYIAK